MYRKPPPTNDGRTDDLGRRGLLRWIGGLAVAGFLGATLVPLKDLFGTAAAASPGDGLVGQRLVYAHHEAGEFATGGHEHSDDVFVRAADFDGPAALDAAVAYPEHLVGTGPFAVLVHRFDPDDLEPPTDLGMTDRGFVAYRGGCPHCGTLLQWADGAGPAGRGVDRCPLHGCEFDPYHGGEVVVGPATRALAQVGVAVDAGGVLELTTAIPGAAADA